MLVKIGTGLDKDRIETDFKFDDNDELELAKESKIGSGLFKDSNRMLSHCCNSCYGSVLSR